MVIKNPRMKPLFFVLAAACLAATSCQIDHSNQDQKLSRDLSDSTSLTGLTGDSVKLVKTGSIQLKVREVEQSVKAISGLAKKYGGAVHYQHFYSPQTGEKELKVSDDSLLVITTTSPQANMTVRIPTQHMEAFLFEAAAVGYRTEDVVLKIDDRSLAYLENELRRGNRIAATTTKQKPDSNTNMQTLQLKDEAVAQYISNKTIDAEAAYSTIELSLSQNTVVQKEMIANYAIADYQLPLSTRIGHAFSNGGEMFLNLLLVLLNLWPFLLFGISLYVAYRLWQRRKVVL